MRITPRHWLLFFILSVGSIFLWFKLAYPQFARTDFSINRQQAVRIATDFLQQSTQTDTARYTIAAVFTSDTEADRYLQKAIGFSREQEFIRAHGFDLFFWAVRFFKENQKEEFRVIISAATGSVTRFYHIIDDSEHRHSPDEATARQAAVAFLGNMQSFQEEDYTFHSKEAKKYDNRTDYSFTWQKRNVYVPWSNEIDSGGGKLTVSATVSGSEILSFSKNALEIPEQFSRHIQKQIHTGRTLSSVFMLFHIVIIVSATYFIILRRNHLAMHATKTFAIFLTLIIFLLNGAAEINEFPFVLFRYDTTASFQSFFTNYFLQLIMSLFLMSVTLMMPTLAGESLRQEIAPRRNEGSFSFYLRSSFFTRNTAKLIIVGYATFVIMLGIQSAAFAIGQKYFGVWIERTWLTQITSSYLPYFSAFVIAFQASFSEEIIFRIFAINWLKKITKNVFIAVIISSVIWGFGHSHYPVFPVWFRGVEVACMGVFLSCVYLNFGIIPVLAGHFIFDVFWGTAEYLLSGTGDINFFSALFIFLIPLFLGVIAFFKNGPETAKKLKWKLNQHQIFNATVLTAFLQNNREKYRQRTREQTRNELVSHNWDVAVVDGALEDFYGPKNH